MKYVIAHKEYGYLYRTPNCRWERTSRIEEAELLDYDKANNVLRNSISPSMRHNWQILSEEEAYAALGITVDATAIMLREFDWKAIAGEQQALYQKLKLYVEQLIADLSQVDLEICDIEHYIEFFALDASRGYKAYRMLKERLIRRREIKDEIAKANCLLTGNATDYASGKITKQINGFDKKSYTPRVLSELFDLDSRGKFSMFYAAAESPQNNCA